MGQEVTGVQGIAGAGTPTSTTGAVVSGGTAAEARVGGKAAPSAPSADGLQLSEDDDDEGAPPLQMSAWSRTEGAEEADAAEQTDAAKQAEEKKRAEEEAKQREIEALQQKIDELESKLEQQQAAGDEEGARQTQRELDAANGQLQQLVAPQEAANPVQAVEGAGTQSPYRSDALPAQIPPSHPYYNQGAPGSATAPGGAQAPGGPTAPGTSEGAGPHAQPLNPEDLKGGTPMGRKLAQLAYAHATDGTGDGQHCYRNVADDLAKVGISVHGESAYMAADQLAQSDKVKEVKGVSQDDLKKLPPGAIVVWNRGGGHEHGHISIAMGDGREASDVMRQQITNYGTSYRVFLPNDQ